MNFQSYFKNKKIVITGGTSGLGFALATLLDKQGAKVAVIARSPVRLATLISQHPSILWIQGDVSIKESIHALAAQVYAGLGEVDILFNVASYLGETPLRSLIDTECEDLELVLQTNLLGPFRLTKLLLPGMLLRGRGIVVNISSDAAIRAYANWGGYSISKAAVDHMSRIFDVELALQGVRFLSVDPGDMDTPMHYAAIPNADPKTLRRPLDSAQNILEILVAEDFSQVRRAV